MDISLFKELAILEERIKEGGNKYLKMNLVQNYNWQHIH